MLAVLLYSAVDPSLNPQNIPGNWPYQVIELAADQSPPDDTWQIMTIDQYGSWIASNQAAYNSWAAAQASANAFNAYAAAAKRSILGAMAFGR